MDKNQMHYPLFMNALQLSINSKLDKLSFEKNEHSIALHFQPRHHDDENLKKFFKLLSPHAKWQDKNSLVWNEATEGNIEALTELLILSRLKDENLKALSQKHHRFKKWTQKLNLPLATSEQTNSPHGIAKLVFQTLEEKNMTLNELAERSNLSLVSLHRFKKGNDIKLSNLLKILKALNLKMKITNE